MKQGEFMSLIIREEKEEEYFKVEELVREAFWNVYKVGCDEHLILHNFRERENYVHELSNVLLLDDLIIGHVMFSKGIVRNKINNSKVDVLYMGPVAIHPKYQHKGYGEYLINNAISKAKESGYNYILIYGNPNYYKKFGFVSAIKYNVLIDGQRIDEEYDFVMIKDLNNTEEININNGPWLYIIKVKIKMQLNL